MKFKTAETALRWAYEMTSSPIVAASPVSVNMGTKERLDIYELHAQAIAILKLLEISLTPIQLAYVRAQFGREAKGIEDGCKLICELFHRDKYSLRSIDKIFRAYCGERVGLREIRKSLNCGMLKAISLRNSVYDALDKVHSQAMDRTHKALDLRGLIYQEGT